jgi:class 3 adenylate cyclase/predicted ATPase
LLRHRGTVQSGATAAADGGASTLAQWLGSLGLSKYEQLFAEHGIDVSVLQYLTDQDLEKIGVLLGHRRKLLAAVRELAGAAALPCEPVPAPAPVPAWAPEPKPQDAAERRQLTVMFCDLVGSTTLSTRLDPEDLRSILNAYHRCATDVVERNGGFVAKYMGDGVLAYFGYPRAGEHDAERALRAGLALVEAVAQLTIGAGAPLQARVGIATGLVVVGDLIGSGPAQEQAVVGETPNMAARLQGLAEPGTVIISDGTRTLTGGLFEYRDLGKVTLKGFAENLQAWQVTGLGAAESRFEALRASSTPLIGRDEEIDLIMRRWEQARNGDGQVVLISGEPGIGKSRIAETILERLQVEQRHGAEPHTRLRYFCSPHHQDSALYPSIAQLERAAGFRREDTPEQRLTKLEAVLARGSNDLREAVPLLADLLSIPSGNRYPTLGLTPQQRKQKTLQVQLAQVEGLAARQPVLMVFEDVHWSDSTTRESLDLLVDRASALRVLVVITFRPEFAPPWIGRPHVMMLNLNRLAPKQRAQMVAYMTDGKALPREIAEQIIERTDGVPLFIEELTKTVVESGIVTTIGDRHEAARALVPLAIPTTLQASLLARLDRLAPTREVAQVAAAVGRQFSHELISAVAGMPQQQVDSALAQLVTAELIFRRGTPPDAEYTFKHALVQDAAYGTLLRSRRQGLHAHIATVMERRFPEAASTRPELLARHFTEAGLARDAIKYWLAAGSQALARSAMVEAEALLTKGLNLISALPEDAWHQEQELELLIGFGRALMATQGYGAPSVGSTYERARALCHGLRRSQELLPIMWGQCMHYLFRADLERTHRLAAELRQLGETRADGATRVMAWRASGIACLYSGNFSDARSYFDRALALYDPADRVVCAEAFPVDALVSLLAQSSTVLVCSGYLDQARSMRESALTEANRLSHAHTLALALWLICLSGWIARLDIAVLLRYADELLSLSVSHGFPYWRAFASMMRGWCLAASGRIGDGIALLTAGLAELRATGSIVYTPSALMMFADVHRLADQPGVALAYLDDAQQLTDTTQAGWTTAETQRMQGELLLLAGDTESAESRFRSAVALACRQNAKLFELRAATSLARLWRDQRRRTEAHGLLAPVYGWFTEGFETPALKEAKALLDELSRGQAAEAATVSA